MKNLILLYYCVLECYIIKNKESKKGRNKSIERLGCENFTGSYVLLFLLAELYCALDQWAMLGDGPKVWRELMLSRGLLFTLQWERQPTLLKQTEN